MDDRHPRKSKMAELQTSLFPVETEAQIQRRVHREMISRNREAFEAKFRKARELSHDPSNGLIHHRVRHAVCAEDVRREMGIQRIPRGWERWKGSNNDLGAVFKQEGWVFIGDIRSTTKGRHNSWVSLWAWRDHADVAREDWAVRESQEKQMTAA